LSTRPHTMLATTQLCARRTRALSSFVQRWSSSLSQSEKQNIQSWIDTQPLPNKQAPLTDHISSSRIQALCFTLPTLDGSSPTPSRRLSENLVKTGSLLSPGHHLTFCNPPAPERELDADATIRLLSPPAPFVRRMWAGGKFEFKRPIRVGDYIQAQGIVSRIEGKRLDSEKPMILVEQVIETKGAEDSETCIRETRSHVYVPVTSERRVRTIKDLPKPDFSFRYLPTETTLFRFSALTFNAHRIHLDREYAQGIEKLPERLVHGPMTALMLLETIEHNRPERLEIDTLEYRATNQLYVNQPITIQGSWLSEKEVKVWAQSEDGVVGMVGEAHLRD